jgi:uncharacterized membrane protein
MLKENKTNKVNTKEIVSNNNLFGKQNYMIMLAGLVVIALGFVLMTGGKSANPAVFDPKEVYSTTRITIAPMLIIAGFILEIVGILKKHTPVEG